MKTTLIPFIRSLRYSVTISGVLRINPAGLLRLHWNPFYDYMEQRVLQFMKLENKAKL